MLSKIYFNKLLEAVNVQS